jgi:hypothetical protein
VSKKREQQNPPQRHITHLVSCCKFASASLRRPVKGQQRAPVLTVPEQGERAKGLRNDLPQALRVLHKDNGAGVQDGRVFEQLKDLLVGDQQIGWADAAQTQGADIRRQPRVY